MPGETGVWIFVLADMCIFAMYFGVFAWDKVALPGQAEFLRELVVVQQTVTGRYTEPQLFTELA